MMPRAHWISLRNWSRVRMRWSLAIRSVLARQRGNAAQAGALEQQARALDPDAAAWAIQRAFPRQIVPTPHKTRETNETIAPM